MRILLYIFSITLLFKVVIFLLLSYVPPNSSFNTSDTKTIPQAVLYFEPSSLSYNPMLTEYSTTIFLNLNGLFASSAQIELSYNSDIFYDVKIFPAKNNLLGKDSDYNVVLQDVRQEYGRVSLALSINDNQREITGNGPIATLSFKSSLSTGSASITFLNKSAVYARLSRKSLLYSTIPFTFQ